MKTILVGIFVLVAGSSLYADNCDHPKDDFDGLYCLNKVYIQADKDLNDAYKKLNSSLAADAKKKLKEFQLYWIQSRNSECSWKDERGFFVNLSCAANKTISRTDFLNARIRECKSTGCQPSRLE
ncbi:hypothetical protein LPTSP3_g19540 [Leptospira kobayashii]|uniref:Lysozyme inhibitor LprI-like N-terminal domain-containing protein n=1 Tax=Leptospira kobayashii TaxID=1917830 RepID=A0ABN6KDH2_9LEPT|nr:lysozyme inhibitor LprI family protein [Leptospira kobayashii]BDA79024.1 hypothetical protein LPTSP3_g19540 [Leptospira kobayashii]